MSHESIEALRHLEPRARQLLLKRTLHYAQGLGERVLGGAPECPQTGADILAMAVDRICDGCKDYAFRDGDILLYYYLCRCCRMAALSLREASTTGAAQLEDDDTPFELTEAAALSFLQRRNGLEEFLALVKEKKLKGKQRAYSLGFAKYGLEGWDPERIAKDLRATPEAVRGYRATLRAFLEEYELRRERHS